VERLQRFLARAGLASRRKCEEMITAGRVRVNGSTVTVLGTQVDPQHDVIEVDGQPVQVSAARVYLLLNKPAGYLSTARDSRGRPTVLDLVASTTRLYPVGRLDLDSEGLLLLTNDGELAQRLVHPRFEHEKEYHVCAEGRPTARTLQRLREGIELEDGFTWPAQVDELREDQGCTWLRFVIHEGRKRQLRRMCAAVGHPVRRLIRVRMGLLSLGDLASGEHRALTADELKRLKQAAGLDQVSSRRRQFDS
jgi:23S rRNA pseudouridine2605 synthase